MKIINMPSFGADMAKGEIAEWKVKEGDKVKKGDIIATIETMKGLIDMEIFDEGTIQKLLVEQGQEIQVGAPIAQLQLSSDSANVSNSSAIEIVDNDGAEEIKPLDEMVSEKATPPTEAQNQTPSTISQQQAPMTNQNTELTHAPKISPAARAKAQQENIDWQQIKPSSDAEGAVLLADVLAYAKHKSSSPVASQDPKNESTLSPMRQAIAAVVSQSKQEIPHYYLQHDICLDQALAWLLQHNQNLAVANRILINALIYCAIAKALSSFTQFNGFFVNGEYQAKNSVHLGNVINLRKGGLVVAAIHDAETLHPAQMMEKLKDQVIRAKEGGLRMSEMQDATVTVSNLGDRGVDSIQSIIFPPQVAIIGLGRVRASPWVFKEKVVSANITTLTLAADHRVSDGHSGARLLQKIDSLLQKPEALL